MSWKGGVTTSDLREEIGRALAKIYPVDADIVVPVPESGRSYAIGYSIESGIRFCEGFSKNRFVGRTYMSPDGKTDASTTDMDRNEKAVLKNPPIITALRGKKIVVIDDSIVRGNVTKNIVESLRSIDAKEVHVRSAFPPVNHPCLYGLDHGPRSGLIAAKYKGNDADVWSYIAKEIKADSVAYLPLPEWQKILGDTGDYCWSCVTGKYYSPLPDTERIRTLML
jgi:amidophosphoribosyltransferase